MRSSLYKSGFSAFILFVLIVGICFHFVTLDRKVYWHDEVYTTMRSAGFTRGEIDQTLFQNRFVSVAELQAFQELKPGSTEITTVNSLATEDPQHPPLYFLTNRLWMQFFGSSITTSRLLPVLFSLLSLPLMYGLAIELFASRPVAILATTLLAISPFDLLFAQTARQYSLLTLLILGTSASLLRSLHQPTLWNWGLYSLGVAIGLYTHPFFGLTLAAHGVYVLLSPRSKFRLFPYLKAFAQFSLAVLGSVILYIPWIVVLVNNQQRALATTDWAQIVQPIDYLLKLWTLSFTALFIDLDFGFTNPWTFALRIPFLILIFLAFYIVYRRTPRSTWLFIFTSFLVPFLLLAIPDLVLGGKRSAVSRYLIACYPAIQLAVAYLLTSGLAGGKAFWRWVVAIVFTASLVSISVSAVADTWWSKDLSYSNGEVARLINAEADRATVVVISDIGDDFTNTGDLMSLSYRLRDQVRFFTVSQPANLAPLTAEPLSANRSMLVFRPSLKLKGAIEQQGWRLENVSEPGRLWRVRQNP